MVVVDAWRWRRLVKENRNKYIKKHTWGSKRRCGSNPIIPGIGRHALMRRNGDGSDGSRSGPVLTHQCDGVVEMGWVDASRWWT